MASDFTAVPVLDWPLATSPATRAQFLAELLHALVNVGFLYLSHPPVSPETFDFLTAYIPRLFALPQDRKDARRMAQSPHFLGYSRLGVEWTKGAADMREQWDFGTPYEAEEQREGLPDYRRLWGPAQWPAEDELPGFKETVLEYLKQVTELSELFIQLVAEALGLPSDGLARFFDEKRGVMHRSKIVKYPPLGEVSSTQGVGPHFDGGFLTFLFQASDHRGLQVQNLAGDWIDVPPIPYTFVINIGKGAPAVLAVPLCLYADLRTPAALETVTRGLACATSHQVLAPPAGSSPRYSVPFFLNIAQDLTLGEAMLDFPPEILKLKEQRGALSTTDSVNYSEFDRLPAGLVTLIGRVKSHPDVAQEHYPDLFKQIFPQGLPAHGEAY
ncbi:Clavaminate synthase-like protein [Vararia minispora EC-137]|uniref:Clavaminate synthase-like protein n=1 Tax=Vararia minispora EC-137 TaxID=1314806 RepID=A0ACB8QFB1_9AGAM|nr:Clavaminate synthase-like protein [Vararia minispora EC-137]